MLKSPETQVMVMHKPTFKCKCNLIQFDMKKTNITIWLLSMENKSITHRQAGEISL